MNPIGLPPAASWNISGNLPFGGGGSGALAGVASGDPGLIAAGYQQAYNSALAMNQANYNNILSGYQQAVAAQTSAQQAIQAGYTNLYNNVLGQVQNSFSGQSQAIDRAAAQNLASGSQQLIDRGLGNTTIQSSLNRGIEADRQYQQTQLTGQQAGMMAQYMSNLGLAGLSNRQNQLNDTTGMALNQLNFMNSVQSKYPDAGMYANLAQQAALAKYGQPGQYGGGSFGGAIGGPKLGYVPDMGPMESGGGAGYGASIGGMAGSPINWSSLSGTQPVYSDTSGSTYGDLTGLGTSAASSIASGVYGSGSQLASAEEGGGYYGEF